MIKGQHARHIHNDDLAIPDKVLPREKSRRASIPTAQKERRVSTTRLQAIAWSATLLYVILLWVASLPQVNLRAMDDLGLLSALPPAFYLAVLTLTVSFGLAIRVLPARAILFSHVALLILIIHGTPHLLYGSLRYSWAWKHVGIIDYIQEHSSLLPDSVLLSAYHNWPGFFSLNAFLTEAAGLESSLSYAGWGPVFFNLIFFGALLLIFRAVTDNVRLVWLAVWFFYITNWVGQDYFSPQALNYYLHLVILGIVLHWFRLVELPSRQTLRRWLWFDWAAGAVGKLLARAHQTEPVGQAHAQKERPWLIVVIAILFATIASSHQLTPFMTIVSLGALVIFQRCSALGLPLLMGVLTITWLLYGAATYMQSALLYLIEALGRVQDVVDSGFIDLAQASPGQQLVATMGRGLTLLLWGLGTLGLVRRLRNGYWDLSIVLLAGMPLVMLLGNSYGGEILFRVYFFTVPFMAFLAAALFLPASESGRSWMATASIIIVSIVMLIGFGFAYYGKDTHYYFTPDEIAATAYLERIAPPGALIVEGSRNYPSRYREDEIPLVRVAVERESREGQSEIIADPIRVFTRWMSDDRFPEAYILITRSMKLGADMIGTMPAGSLERIEQTLIDSPSFQMIYDTDDARIFILVESDEASVDVQDVREFRQSLKDVYDLMRRLLEQRGQ